MSLAELDDIDAFEEQLQLMEGQAAFAPIVRLVRRYQNHLLMQPIREQYTRYYTAALAGLTAGSAHPHDERDLAINLSTADRYARGAIQKEHQYMIEYEKKAAEDAKP